MAESRPFQTNFTSGEFTPRLDGRIDISKYTNALSLCKNFRILQQGGATRRPGLHWVAEVKTSTALTRLLQFEFSDVQAYIIEAGNLYMRFYFNSGRIESPPGTPVEIVTPYVTADLPALKFAQSADTMYIAHQNYPPQKLTRTSHTAWTITPVSFLDGPYLPINTTATTLTASANTGTVTLTASTAIFQSGHVGSYWRIKGNTTWGWVKVTAFTDSTHVTAVVQAAVNNGAAGQLDFVTPGTSTTVNWSEGAWSDVRGYPRTSIFYEQRLSWAGSKNNPQTIWGSVSGDFENMAQSKSDGTVLDTHSVIFSLASDKVNVIRWLKPARVLLIGTLGGEFGMSGGSSTVAAITPSNVVVKGQTTYGSNLVDAVRPGTVVALFVQRSGRKIRELAYDVVQDQYKAPDLTLLAEHLFPQGMSLTYAALQREPDPTLWAVRSDGLLLGMIYDREQDVVGWHRHTTGPNDADKFEAVAVIPHPNLDRDQVWVIVNRTINGATKRFVEYLDDGGNPFSAYLQLNTDSALTYMGAPATVFGGLDHLAGAVVNIVGDGAVYPNQTVPTSAPFQVTISPAASNVEIGLPYTSILTTVRPEVKLAGGGTSQGKKKRWAQIYVRLLNSLGLSILGDIGDAGIADPTAVLDQIPFRDSSMAMGQPPPMFTGDVRKSNLGWTRDGKITVQQTQPLPCHVLSIFGDLEVGE